jgi:hypothetical protein
VGSAWAGVAESTVLLAVTGIRCHALHLPGTLFHQRAARQTLVAAPDIRIRKMSVIDADQLSGSDIAT